MTFFHALLLGIIQGITEFFPVSSSGHLELAQILLGLPNLKNYIPFNLVCHLGTLLAVIIVFRKDLLNIVFVKQERTKLWLLLVALSPLLPLYPLLGTIKEAANHPEYLGYFFITTALILFLGEKASKWLQRPEALKNSKSYRDALCIGIFQAFALIPGISRSGLTISGARIMGWNLKDAVRFSFLLAIPTICGGALVEMKSLISDPNVGVGLEAPHYIIGFVTSFAVGFLTLNFLLRFIKKGTLLPFAWYCLLLGVSVTLFL